MKYILFLLALVSFGQVTIVVNHPTPNEVIGQIYQADGTVSTATGGAVINQVDLWIDNAFYETVCNPVAPMCPGVSSQQWLQSVYAQAMYGMSVGQHSFYIKATDNMGGSAQSDTIFFTVRYSFPSCANTKAGNGVVCKDWKLGDSSITPDTVTYTFPGGNTMGDTIIVEAVGVKNQLKQGQLATTINSSALTFDVAEQPCNGACSWPTPPFYAEFADVASSEKVHVTNVTGSNPWHFTVDVRGVGAGVDKDCFFQGPAYPAGGVGVSYPTTCSSASSHTLGAGSIVNTWQLSLIAAGAISDTDGNSWNLMLHNVSGPLGDFSNTPGAIWYTTVGSTTITTDVISVTDTNILAGFTGMAVKFSGLGALEASPPALISGFGGPGNDVCTGNYTSVVGDFNIAFLGGAPTFVLPGATEFAQNLRPTLMLTGQVSDSTTANICAHMNPEGLGAQGFAFKTTNATPVVVKLNSPIAGIQIAQQYAGPNGAIMGTAKTIAGGGATINSIVWYLDGSICSPSFCDISSGLATNFSGHLYAENISVGAHTVFIRATDTMGNSGDSVAVPFTVVHTSPACPAHTNISGAFYIEGCDRQVAFTNTVSSTYAGGFSAGETIFALIFTGRPSLQQGTLHAAIGSGSLPTFVEDDNSLGGSPGWPTPPFDVCIDQERFTITGITAGPSRTFTVGARGVMGGCVYQGSNYPTGTGAFGGTLQPSSAASAHSINRIVQHWQDGLIPTGSITDTHGLTWTQITTQSTGPLNDAGGFPSAVWRADVSATDLTPDTITIALTGATFIYFDTSIYSGIGVMDGMAVNTGYTDPDAYQLMASTNFSATPGDLNLAFIAGAPGFINNPTWNVRTQDVSRPFTMIADQPNLLVAGNATLVSNVDGFNILGISVKPAGVAVQGQSALLSSTNQLSNGSVAKQVTTCRTDFEYHDGTFTSGAGGSFGTLNPCGMHFSYSFGGGAYSIQIYNDGAVSGPCAGNPYLYSLTNLPTTGGHKNAYFRYQVNFTTKKDSLEEWDGDGTYHQVAACTWTVINAPGSDGLAIGVLNSGDTANFGFMHIYPNNVGLNAKMPTFGAAVTGAVAYYSFDTATGNLVDQSSNAYTLTNTGSVTFPDTPAAIQALVLSVPKVCKAPSWSPWVSMKIGGTGCTGILFNGLDGTSSLSQATGSDAVTATWSNISGPATPTISSPSSLTTDIGAGGTLSAFGLYTYNLHVVDAATNTADKQLSVGAVAMDNKGVVVPSDPKVTQAFGPMIGFGQNPWGYMDERNCAAVNLQINGKLCNGDQVQAAGNPYFASALWLTPATGTITYPFAGIGLAPGQGCYGSGTSGGTQATLTSSILATDTTIAIHHAECLSGLLSLPTWVTIGSNYGGLTTSCTNPVTCGVEIVRVVATTATTGNAILTVSTDTSGFAASRDGRGLAGAIYNNNQPVVPAQAWPINTVVGEMRMVGSGTSFITDPQRPLAPAGAPGPPGAVIYSMGTVHGVAGSTRLTGSSTSWTQNVYTGSCPSSATLVSTGLFNTDCNHNMQALVYVRVAGTHNTGIPFAFWAFVSDVAADNSYIDISRALPADFDAGNFNYKITSARYFSLDFVIGGNTFRSIQQGLGCESETACFALPAHDIAPINTNISATTAVHFSYKDTLGAQSPFGPNFYGTGIALRAFYYRSGYTPALTAANQIDDNWPRDPEICGGWCGAGIVLDVGGGVNGGIINKALNVSTPLTWLDVSRWGDIGASVAMNSCNDADPRDQGYPQAWIALLGLFDTDPTRQMTWNAGLLNWVTRDTTCRRNVVDGYSGVQVNSWAGASVWAANGPAMTLTAGDVHVTGSGFTSTNVCSGLDDGMGFISVTHGSTVATVISGTVNAGLRLLITDTSGTPIAYTFQFSGTGGAGATINLAYAWPGATNTSPGLHFMVESNPLGYMSSIGNSNADYNPFLGLSSPTSIAQGRINNFMLQKVWACQFVDSTHLLLNRPWDDINGVYFLYSYVVSGFEVQPFMATGPKAAAMNWAAQNTNPVIATAYTTNLSLLGTWAATYGIDSIGPNYGMPYGRVTGNCEPIGVPNSMVLFDSTHESVPNGQQSSCGNMGLAGTLGGGNGEFTSRVNLGEGENALNKYYIASPTLLRKDLVDHAYGAIFGNCALSTGVYCDNHYVDTAGELSNVSLGAYKWTGFFFGMGMAHQWPAVRVENIAGAPDPSVNDTGGVGDKGGVNK